MQLLCLQANPGRSLTHHRKTACSFRDLLLLQIFQVSLTSLTSLQTEGQLSLTQKINCFRTEFRVIVLNLILVTKFTSLILVTLLPIFPSFLPDLSNKLTNGQYIVIALRSWLCFSWIPFFLFFFCFLQLIISCGSRRSL